MKYNHLSSPLQFVSGFGPRKAKHLLSNLAKKQVDLILKREELERFLGPVVYRNAIGFIKINEMLHLDQIIDPQNYDHRWLDFTRIHPEHYDLAEKIATDCFDQPSKDTNLVVFKTLKDKLKT